MTPPSTGLSLWMEARNQIIAGASAGLVEVCIMHPLDLVKTRLQLQGSGPVLPGDMSRYSSLADCARKMIQSEGYFSFYKGIIPPILAETPKRALKFVSFEQYKKMFSTDHDPKQATTTALFLAGLGSGLTEAVAVNPFERVKVQMQADRASRGQALSTSQTAKILIQEGGFGLRGLNRGLTSTMARNGIFNMVYFGVYYSAKKATTPTTGSAETIRLFFLGLISGVFASCVNIPADVAKSRIQGPQPAAMRKYHSLIQTIGLVYREEGVKSLYRGLLPKVLRLGPGGGIMLIVYDKVSAWLVQ